MFKHAAISLLAFAAVSAAEPARYQIDASHSSAQFTVRHMMVSNVRGEFTKLSGVVLYDPADLSSSSIEATIDAASINTRNAKRDDHLRSADFFDAAKFPTLTFVSKRIYTAGGETRIKGDLTIHGVTREVDLQLDGPVEQIKDASGNTRIGASATTRVSRKDFGLTWNKLLESGGAVVSDEVTSPSTSRPCEKRSKKTWLLRSQAQLKSRAHSARTRPAAGTPASRARGTSSPRRSRSRPRSSGTPRSGSAPDST